ncbi:MAG: hypothetical protein IAI50_05910, partial [Candidatus Eremiobacteraeota bacterium]|nr:hypothetical protein [Candidatus Eremiobacteraeota bacterium]
MIEVVEVSPKNEIDVAKKLAASIASAWPWLAASNEDRVTIVVGLQVVREIDLFVALELGAPRSLPARKRRDGTNAPTNTVQAAALVIEVKQLDASRFHTLGPEIFPDYRDGHRRSVNAQVADAQIALRTYA